MTSLHQRKYTNPYLCWSWLPFTNPHLLAAAEFSSLVSDKADDKGDKADREALARYAMVDARLRRLCEKKPSGKIQVPEQIHLQWKQGGTARDELRVLLERYEFDKDSFGILGAYERYQNESLISPFV